MGSVLVSQHLSSDNSLYRCKVQAIISCHFAVTVRPSDKIGINNINGMNGIVAP